MLRKSVPVFFRQSSVIHSSPVVVLVPGQYAYPQIQTDNRRSVKDGNQGLCGLHRNLGHPIAWDLQRNRELPCQQTNSFHQHCDERTREMDREASAEHLDILWHGPLLALFDDKG